MKRFPRISLVTALFLSLLLSLFLPPLLSHPAADAQEPEPDLSQIVIHDSVDLGLRQLYVTVTKSRGRRVLDLEAGEFRILDEGEPQEIVTFEKGDIPFTAVVLIDGSISMEGPKLTAALEGARAFVDGMREHDEARLVVASDRILAASPFVSKSESLAAILEGVEATGGTTLNDHLFVALDAAERRQGRRVVILLSDGYDAHSLLTMDEVRDVARRSQALVYWLQIRVRGETDRSLPHTVWRSPEEARRSFETLVRTVEETGGRLVPISGPADMEPAFREILAELREQYAIGYYPTSPVSGDGDPWREVTVEVARRKLEVRYRDGYFGR